MALRTLSQQKLSKQVLNKLAVSILKGSVSFNGSGAYLSIADNNALDISGDFSLEFWVNVDADVTSNAGIVGHRSPSGWTNGTDWAVRVQTGDGKIGFGYDISGAYYDMGTYTAGTWSHHAITRSGTTLRTFKNGTLVTTISSVSSAWNSSEAFLIGRNISGLDYKGSISNLRLVKNTATYTANFTTPSSYLRNDVSGTSLLTCQNPSTIVDNSSNAFTITVTGSATASSASPF